MTADEEARDLVAAVTLDVHDNDAPGDIEHAAEWLAGEGVPATFFVASTLFGQARYRPVLRRLDALSHEVGSHGHHHDWAEIAALGDGGTPQLGFLRESWDRCAELFGRAPVSFRSPCWCWLGEPARDELQALGYRVDSSATPQRPSLLGSLPFERGWMLFPRRPHFIRPGLLELPTSTLLLPAGSTTFRVLRRGLSLALAHLFLAEARALPGRAVVIQFHAEDFNPDAAPRRHKRGLRVSDFLPGRRGGFGFRNFLPDGDRARVSATTHAVVRLLAAHRCMTVGAAAELFAAREGMVLAGA